MELICGEVVLDTVQCWSSPSALQVPSVHSHQYEFVLRDHERVENCECVQALRHRGQTDKRNAMTRLEVSQLRENAEAAAQSKTAVGHSLGAVAPKMVQGTATAAPAVVTAAPVN